jgi:hypothetical protein
MHVDSDVDIAGSPLSRAWNLSPGASCYRADLGRGPALIGSEECSRGRLAAVIIDIVTNAGDGPFESVVSYLGWWDCPRSGVVLLSGQPYYFECRFSEELDDYPGQFRLWPIAEDELADELEAWQTWDAWRDEYDSGLRPGPFPGDRQTAALERALRRRQHQPPPGARTAIPEWRLDRDRSFAGRIPTHMARWTFVD